ncbi:DUF6640 family protein [Streptomyces nigrescens]|uniref:DUF6640 family protein n=1 Tax=Streptomyces nigrescens TaxID=1920 RepID=UPI0022529703|nr:DUF6640 family protein [Streptomyces libani]MCX5449307.1 acetyltransferase [Streptomyces libani]
MSSNSTERASHGGQGTKTRATAGKVLLTVVAVFTGISPYVADWNETHVLNPLWPPHAKFHNGQTMAMGTLLAVATLFFVWRRRGDARSHLYAATGFAGLYWVSQAAAILYPGAAYFDHPFDTPDMHVMGLPVQAVIEIVMLGLIAAAVALSRPALPPGRPGLTQGRPEDG